MVSWYVREKEMNNVYNLSHFNQYQKYGTYCFLSLGPKKCLKVIKGSQDHTEHVSSAAWKCSKDNAKLVSSRNCNELHKTYLDVKKDKKSYQNSPFWIGNSAPGDPQLDSDKRNWFKNTVLDS